VIPQGLPEHTLGWEILDWSSQMLAQPDGDNQGDAWQFTDEQAMFILWFYAVGGDGKFLYRNAVLERSKRLGKITAACSYQLR
jgi:hypothetical protein